MLDWATHTQALFDRQDSNLGTTGSDSFRLRNDAAAAAAMVDSSAVDGWQRAECGVGVVDGCPRALAETAIDAVR